jgi:hypothetical protein
MDIIKQQLRGDAHQASVNQSASGSRSSWELAAAARQAIRELVDENDEAFVNAEQLEGAIGQRSANGPMD